MLEQLIRYAQREQLVAEPGFGPKNVHWGLVLDASGRLLSVQGFPPKGRSFPCCPELSDSEMKKGGPGCRHFLVDNAEVVTLLSKEVTAKVEAKHAYFRRFHREAARELPELGPVAAFLDDPAELARAREELAVRKARPTDNLTFAVLAEAAHYPVEGEAWHAWWRRFRGELLGKATAAPAEEGEEPAGSRTMICLATGQPVQPVLTQPKIRGLSDVGGLATGDALASYKQDSFRSFGLVQSENAAISQAAASLYRAGLNALIEKNGQRLAGAKVVHWYSGKVAREEDPLAFVVEPPERGEAAATREARKLLTAIERGERPDLADNRYFALTLSGASGRVMVRDFLEGRFGELLENVNLWFEDLEIVRRDGLGPAPDPKFLAVGGALVRELKELASPVVATLWRVALAGEDFPQNLLARAVERFRADVFADAPFLHARVGLMKAYHRRRQRRHPNREGAHPMEPGLKEDHPAPAYQCGRLLAALAALQYSALGDVGAGVVQRYFAAASATPSLVLGRMLRLAQHHLGKLERGMAFWHQERIANILRQVDSERLPRTLTLEEQSLFALGYYQQIAADRGAANARRLEAQAAQDATLPRES
ncbi:MAG: type I-C CRISPR-associated protein Cas8c/Csd1 [Thermoanaerobaculia bacterium]